ncbi:MAG: hypothetical protein K8T10_03340 [Candidatus Eremiobacteraeota bacterium]|nr:hypothetical protein [Candidatus Eremiobacteraeota bacterium]
MKSRTPSKKNRNKTGGVSLRWILTIVVIIAVFGFEVYLFSRYSLWFKKANAQASNRVNANVADNRESPTRKGSSNGDIKAVIPSPPMREFHPTLPDPAPGQESHGKAEIPPPVATSKPISDKTSSLSASPELSRDVVNPAALKLMDKVSSLTFLRGIIELESRPNYFLAPGREKKILEICINIKKNRENKDIRNKLLSEARYTFFAGLNEKQMKFVERNMRDWENNPGDYRAPDGEDQLEFMLDKCIRVLSQKVDKNPVK